MSSRKSGNSFYPAHSLIRPVRLQLRCVLESTETNLFAILNSVDTQSMFGLAVWPPNDLAGVTRGPTPTEIRSAEGVVTLDQVVCCFGNMHQATGGTPKSPKSLRISGDIQRIVLVRTITAFVLDDKPRALIERSWNMCAKC